MAYVRRSDGVVNVVRSGGVRAGVSLLEVIVTLAVLGVLTTVVGLSWQRQNAPTETATAASEVAAARRQALATGTSVTVNVEPTPTVLSTSISPYIASASRLQIASPNPVPP